MNPMVRLITLGLRKGLIGFLLVLSFLPSAALAASACTAMWGLLTYPTNNNYLAYFNTSSNRWVTVTTNLTTAGHCGANPNNAAVTAALSCNALAGSNVDGKLYFVDRAPLGLRSYDVNSGVVTQIGTIPPAQTSTVIATNTLGATFDNSDRLLVYATAGGANQTIAFAEINKATAAVVGTWTIARDQNGSLPAVAGSGDVAYSHLDNRGFVISNTTPQPSYHAITLTAGGSFARTTSPALQITGANNVAVQGVAVDPATQLSFPNRVYFGSATPGSTTYVLDRTTGAATLIFSTTSFTVTDMGNCPNPPDAPVVSKSFADSFLTGGTNTTTTLTISIQNANSAPIWVLDDFKDTLPAGMVLASGTVSGSCVVAGNTFLAAAGSNSVTFVADGKIPQSPGCSISFVVSATASLSAYTNTIAAGALTTTSGVNAAAATATLKVGTDFSMAKQVRLGTTDPLANTATISALKTMQYVLTITNSSSGGTGSATFTDTLPTQITPVLTVVAGMAGGGTCTTATSTVSGVTQITGTLTNAPPGAVCTVTVTARAANTSGTVVNTATLAPVSTTGDASVTNNLATATATLSPATTLTIAKTNGVNTVTYGGTTAYTLTVANLGPGNAPNSLVKDPTATGLVCTSVVCGTGSASAVCPTAGNVTIANLQGSGIALTPTFSAGHSLTFRVSCTVTATGT